MFHRELIDGFPYTRLIDVDGVRFTADFNKETKYLVVPCVNNYCLGTCFGDGSEVFLAILQISFRLN